MEGRISYQIGPVAASAAEAWLAATRTNLERLSAAGEKAPFRIPDEVADQLSTVLDAWADVLPSDPYLFEGSEAVDVARTLLTYWLNLVSLSRQQRLDLDIVDWPAASVPFERALGRAILASLGADERLRRIWRAASRRNPSASGTAS